ncbi:hypothetical protein FB451DRAFT_1393149 [Mycena latifolia]|nr:hypothetical protein FB451DRAFT_1393149 [Mycena latifolia]
MSGPWNARRPPFLKPPAPIVHAEDSQPNEMIDKRRAVPSLVVPSRPQRSNSDNLRWGFRGGKSRGRGGHSNAPLASSSSSSAPNSAFPSRRARGQPIPLPRSAPVPIPVPPRNASTRDSPAETPSAAPQTIPRTRISPISRPPNAPTAPRAPPSIKTSTTLPTPATTPTVPEQTEPTLPIVVSRDPSSPPPTKRRRVAEAPIPIKIEDSPIPLSPPPQIQPQQHPEASPPSTPRVKLEARTPSPPPADPPPVRRAVTSGSKRYFPVPPNCTRIDPDYIANRRNWARRECAVLRDLGLHVDKFFFRDDGMVIEWTSPAPVWLDTLRPVHAKPRLSPPPSVVHEIIDVDAEPPPSPAPRPASPSLLPPSDDVVSSLPPPDDASLPPPEDSSVCGPDDVSLPPADDTAAEVTTEAPVPSDEVEQMTVEDEQAVLQQLSLDFIQRYILTFDRDRAALARAYTDDAIFSFRDTGFACPSHFTFQRGGASSSKRTMPALPALAGYRFAPAPGKDEIEVDFDTLALGPEQPEQVLLSVHGQLVGAGAGGTGKTLAIDQAFVLRRSAVDLDWPLVALSHQMIVRDTPWVRWTGSLEGLRVGRQADG